MVLIVVEKGNNDFQPDCNFIQWISSRGRDLWVNSFLDYIKRFINDATFNLLGYGFMVNNYASRSTAYALKRSRLTPPSGALARALYGFIIFGFITGDAGEKPEEPK